ARDALAPDAAQPQEGERGVKPKRIQRKRTKGWTMPPNAAYVGRPTKWGNPYFMVSVIGDDEHKRRERQSAVDRYRQLLEARGADYARSGRKHGPAGYPHDAVAELRGKDLACWCPLDQPCHADVLLEI